MDNQKMNNNRPDQDPEDGNNKKDDMNKKSLLVMVVLAIAVMIIAQMLSGKIASASQKEVTYTEFMQDVKDGKVTKVELDSDRIYYEVKNQKNVKYYTGNVQDERLYEELDKAGVTYSRKVIDTTTYVMSSILSFVLPMVLMVAVMMIFYRFAFKGGGGVMGVGKSNAKLYVQDKTGVTFQDVAGQEESKESLREIVDFLHNPEKYTKIGAKLPKGALLVGPPGTGKTLLAKAVAGEAGVPFFSLSGSDFVEMFVGVGASRVRDLFKQAQQNAPCIIFIDELDAIGKSRDSRFGGNDEREQTLNQLLAEMDGFDSSKGIIILAATNRPEILDKALLRPGRFDRRIIVERPDLKGRIDVLKVHAKNVCMDETVDFKEIALATSGAVGSDLANIINEAKYLMSEKQIREELVTMLAGRAAESIVFDSVTTGASNDIEQATKLARAMITQYGMSEKFGLIGLTTVEDQYLGGRATLNCGEATAAEIDQEVMKILKAAYDQALALLADNRDCLDKIAAFLIERETITGKEFMKIFREVKGIPDSETEQAEANVSNPAKNDSQPDGQDEPALIEEKTDNGASSESDINVSLETKAED